MQIDCVTVIGANGTMGKNVSAIFASYGNAKVYMAARKYEDAKKAAETAYLSVKAQSVKANCIPVDYSRLEACIKESDLIFESTKEDFAVKREITKRIGEYMTEESVCVSGTSGLSLTKLAEELSVNLKSRYMGMHMFNPPYQMTLCELISTKYTDRRKFEALREYAEGILRRTVVEVADSPAFLGNRIGFQFINEAMQKAEQYKDNGGIDYIDAILGGFTGRNMPPLLTADFVGLDVHKAIVDNLYENTNDFVRESFLLPEFVEHMISEGNYGRKSGQGLYRTERTESGSKNIYVYDIAIATYRKKNKYVFPFVENVVAALEVGEYKAAKEALTNNRSQEAELCVKLLLNYILYSLNITTEVGDDIHSADAVMAAGFNWCPPLALVEFFGGREDFRDLCTERIDKKHLDKMPFEDLIEKIESSKYDYRKFIKAKD